MTPPNHALLRTCGSLGSAAAWSNWTFRVHRAGRRAWSLGVLPMSAFHISAACSPSARHLAHPSSAGQCDGGLSAGRFTSSHVFPSASGGDRRAGSFSHSGIFTNGPSESSSSRCVGAGVHGISEPHPGHLTMRCSEPGHRVSVAIVAFMWAGSLSLGRSGAQKLFHFRRSDRI